MALIHGQISGTQNEMVIATDANGALAIGGASDYGAVIKSDTTALSYSSIYIGTGGNVAVSNDAGVSAVTFSNVPGGSILPVAGNRIMSTNTTAADMVWLA